MKRPLNRTAKTYWTVIHLIRAGVVPDYISLARVHVYLVLSDDDDDEQMACCFVCSLLLLLLLLLFKLLLRVV
jgi:hypothetical protein